MMIEGTTVMTGAQKNMILSALPGVKFFLEDQLDRIGDRLQQTKGSGAVRSDARLDAGQRPALIPGQVGKACQQRKDHDQ